MRDYTHCIGPKAHTDGLVFAADNCHKIGLKWYGYKYHQDMLHYRYHVIDSKLWVMACLRYGIQADTDQC
jgi:hypothetical protein